MLGLAGVLEQQRSEQPRYPWSIYQQRTALLSGAAVLITASLTLPSTTPCESWQDACVVHQHTTSLSSHESNLLIFVAKEPLCLQHAAPWSLDICFHSVLTCPPGRNARPLKSRHPFLSSVHLTTATEVRRSGWITDGRRSDWTSLRYSVLSSSTSTPTPTSRITAWVRLNRLRTVVGRFRSCMHKWGASSSACECRAEE